MLYAFFWVIPRRLNFVCTQNSDAGNNTEESIQDLQLLHVKCHISNPEGQKVKAWYRAVPPENKKEKEEEEEEGVAKVSA